MYGKPKFVMLCVIASRTLRQSFSTITHSLPSRRGGEDARVKAHVLHGLVIGEVQLAEDAGVPERVVVHKAVGHIGVGDVDGDVEDVGAALLDGDDLVHWLFLLVPVMVCYILG